MFYKVFEESYWSVKCCEHRFWFKEIKEVSIESEERFNNYIELLKGKFAEALYSDEPDQYYFRGENIVTNTTTKIPVNPYAYFIQYAIMHQDGSRAFYFTQAFDENIWQEVLEEDMDSNDSSGELFDDEYESDSLCEVLGQDCYGDESD